MPINTVPPATKGAVHTIIYIVIVTKMKQMQTFLQFSFIRSFFSSPEVPVMPP